MAAPGRVPDELIEDILSRVPTKSLVRFKTASKKWYFLLSQDYNFAKFHLKRSKTKTKNHQPVFHQISYVGNIFQSFDLDNTDASRNKFNSPVEVERWVVLVGSANGLMCLAPSFRECCYIWNPCTGECKRIKVPIPEGSRGLRVFGFGYDSCSDDYKIVANWDKHFRVFSLKTNSWKKFEYSFLESDQAFHFNGALHWCHNEEIAAFDLAKEVFYYIKLPDEMKVTTKNGLFVCLWEYKGSLCLSDAIRSSSIWVMKIYGDPKSWVKFRASIVLYKKPLGISTLGEVVYHMVGEEDGSKGGFEFVKSDIEGKMSYHKKLLIYDLSQPAFVYTESLISPRCFDALHERSKTRPRKQRKTTTT